MRGLVTEKGVQNPDDLADVICKWPLNEIGGRDEEASGKAENKWEAERGKQHLERKDVSVNRMRGIWEKRFEKILRKSAAPVTKFADLSELCC